MTVIKIVAVIVGVMAVFMTFKAKFIIEKLFKKQADERMILRVKYAALALAVIAFLSVFILVK